MKTSRNTQKPESTRHIFTVQLDSSTVILAIVAAIAAIAIIAHSVGCGSDVGGCDVRFYAITSCKVVDVETCEAYVECPEGGTPVCAYSDEGE